jgi:hypothetical protein
MAIFRKYITRYGVNIEIFIMGMNNMFFRGRNYATGGRIWSYYMQYLVSFY